MESRILDFVRRGIWLIAAIVLCLAGTARAETDVTAKVQVVKGALSYDLAKKQSFLNVSVKNISTDVLLCPVKVVVASVTPATVTVANADGVTADGKPYFNYTTATGQLLPGVTIAAKRWNFANPSAVRFSYTTKVLATIPEATASIGPLGGTVQINNASSSFGNLSMEIPADALVEPVTIAIGKTDEIVPSVNGITFSGSTLKLSPSGQVFNEPIIIKIPYDKNAGIPVVFSYSEITGKHEVLPIVSVDDVNGLISVKTAHFSFMNIFLSPPPLTDFYTIFDINADSFRAENSPAYLEALPTSQGGICWGFANFSKWYFDNKNQMNGPLREAYGPTGDGCNQIKVAEEAYSKQKKESVYQGFIEDYHHLMNVSDGSVFKQIYNAMTIEGSPQLLYMKDRAHEGHAVLVTSIVKIDNSTWSLNIYDNTDNKKYHQIYYKFDPSQGFDSGHLEYQLGEHFFTYYIYPGEQWIVKNHDMEKINEKYSVYTSCFDERYSDNDDDGITEIEGDCNDNNSAMHPNTTWYRDADGDGYSDGTTITQCQRGLYYYLASELHSLQGDCNDNSSSVHPGATEFCNGIDDNCDGAIDNNAVDAPLWYRDADGDNYGRQSVSVQACARPAGYIADSSDCNDGNSSVRPNAAEACGNQIDDNCDGQVDEGCNVMQTPIILYAGYDSGHCWNYIVWNNVGAPQYKMYWGTSPGVTTGSNLAAPTTTTDYGHTGVLPGWTYYYRVMAVSADGHESGLSNEVASPVPANAGQNCGNHASTSLPDTGQTKCYNNSSEIPCPQPGQAFHGQDAQYTINPMSYTVYNNGTVTDNITGLMWQRQDDGVTRTWYDAVSYCDSLNFAGYTDWRLPSKKELVSIIDYSKPYPGPTIDPSAFPGTKSSDYWSSTTYAHYTNYAWSVYFSYGYVNHYYKYSNMYARCVRGGQ